VPHVDFESRELLSRVQSVLDSMSDRPRAVFVLRRFEEMELSEIATNLDVSLATVKRDLERATMHVARAIEGDKVLRARLDSSPVGSIRGRVYDRS
jgi:RNA polymerase sigma factor (sigma-70 family)